MSLTNYKNILVAVDGSDTAETAFRRAVDVASSGGGRLVIAHVVDTRAYQSYSALESRVADLAKEEAEDTLNEFRSFAEEKGVKDIVTVVEFGSPRTQISTVLPEAYDVDLILLGATGLNAVERLLIGSVSEYVIHHAECDVLIVRQDD